MHASSMHTEARQLCACVPYFFLVHFFKKVRTHYQRVTTLGRSRVGRTVSSRRAAGAFFSTHEDLDPCLKHREQ